MSTLDHNNLKNYCTVSNLSFLSRVIEKIIMWQLFAYLSSHDLLCPSQSAYRPCCSTDMTLPKRTREILLALDGGDVFWSVLCFTTISEPVPPYSPPLTSIYGISGTILSWFESYLTSRTQTVTVNGQTSGPADVFFVFHRAQFVVLSSSFCALHLSALWLRLLSPTSCLLMTHSYFSPVLLIRYMSLSWPCRHASLTWRPGCHKKSETEWQEDRGSPHEVIIIEPFFLTFSPSLFVLALQTFHSRPVLAIFDSRFQIT